MTCLSQSGGLVECAKGLTIKAQHSYADAPALDVLIYPGGRGTRPQLTDDAQLDWVRRQRETRAVADERLHRLARLRRGRTAVAAPGDDALGLAGPARRTRPDDRVRPETRFVDDGDIITAAGVSAGIDMALHLVDRLAGTARAREVRRYIQYDPAPPI